MVDGDSVLSFLSDVDKVIEEAGGGQYRAFKLMAGLKALGIVLKREPVDIPEQPVLSTVRLDNLPE